jgi:hypothetical protein
MLLLEKIKGITPFRFVWQMIFLVMVHGNGAYRRWRKIVISVPLEMKALID